MSDAQPPRHIEIEIIALAGLITTKTLQYCDFYSLSVLHLQKGA